MTECHFLEVMVNFNRPFPSYLKPSSLSKRGLVHNHSYENGFNLHVNEINMKG